VSLVYDDVVQENPILKGFPIFDMERIEVLRGPQGTLFGRNSPAGVVKFDSAKPGKKFEGYGSLSIGRYSMSMPKARSMCRWVKARSLRVSLLSRKAVVTGWTTPTDAGPTQELEGYHDNAAAGAMLAMAPIKNLSVLLGVHTRDLKGSARLFRANIIKPGSNDLVSGFDPSKVSL
jgi:iron complex outermembrane receptor protein